MIALNKVDYSIRIQLNNGAPRDCVLLKPVAEALSKAQQEAKLSGLTIKVLDCYRPFSSTPKWDEGLRRDYARGNTVEAVFLDINGAPVALPAPHDQAIMLSSRPYKKSEAKRYKEKLTALLLAQGFQADAKQWWRFRYAAEANADPLDFPVTVPKPRRAN